MILPLNHYVDYEIPIYKLQKSSTLAINNAFSKQKLWTGRNYLSPGELWICSLFLGSDEHWWHHTW